MIEMAVPREVQQFKMPDNSSPKTGYARIVDQTTRLTIFSVIAVVICFAFDHELARLIHFFGFANAEASNIGFISSQYEFFDNRTKGSFDVDALKAFEVVVWFSIFMSFARLAIGLITMESAESIKIQWKAKNITVLNYFFIWMPMMAGLLLASAFGVEGFTSDALYAGVFEYSPKALICFEAIWFCGASLMLSTGVVVLLQLIFGRTAKASA